MVSDTLRIMCIGISITLACIMYYVIIILLLYFSNWNGRDSMTIGFFFRFRFTRFPRGDILLLFLLLYYNIT